MNLAGPTSEPTGRVMLLWLFGCLFVSSFFFRAASCGCSRCACLAETVRVRLGAREWPGRCTAAVLVLGDDDDRRRRSVNASRLSRGRELVGTGSDGRRACFVEIFFKNPRHIESLNSYIKY